MAKRLVRLPAVLQMVGMGKTLVYDLMRRQSFPASVPIGGRSRAWVEDEVSAWIEERIALRDAA